MGAWRKEILEHTGLEDDDIERIGEDPDNRAVFLSSTPKWMAAIASRSQGHPASSKMTIDDLTEHAVLSLCIIDPDDQPLYIPELDGMGCQTGKSRQLHVKDGHMFPGESVHWMPFGAETHNLFVQNSIDPDDIIVLEGEAAVQFAARNFPQVLAQQVSDPENIKANAAQYDDDRREALLQGREPANTRTL